MKVIKCFKFKKWICFVLVVVLAGFMIINFSVKANNDYLPYKIILDAGHGGRDDGCSGSNGVKESEVNLAITKKVKALLEDYGFRVVLTRKDENGLYEENVDNYKLSDMAKRLEIIEKEKPNFVISIHQNSYSDSNQKGAQAFYQEGDELGQALAEKMQTQLFAQLPNARGNANKGDYYILNEIDYPGIIVECGYLTNVEEEMLLKTSEYQTKVAYAIVCGVVKFFEVK